MAHSMCSRLILGICCSCDDGDSWLRVSVLGWEHQVWVHTVQIRTISAWKLGMWVDLGASSSSNDHRKPLQAQYGSQKVAPTDSEIVASMAIGAVRNPPVRRIEVCQNPQVRVRPVMRPSSDGVRVCSSYRFCALGRFCFLGRASAGSTDIAAIIAATRTAARPFFMYASPFPSPPPPRASPPRANDILRRA
jgi:hypothetical protein